MLEGRRILPVILSGGSGTRLWPASRENYPKQILSMGGEPPLLVETARRVKNRCFLPPLIICNQEHRFLVQTLLADHDITCSDIVLEPMAKGTAAAAIVSAQYALKHAECPLILLLPSDHQIADQEAFLQAIAKAIPAAEQGSIVTFGIKPGAPETGYGYIRPAAATKDEGLYQVSAFREKPDSKAAQGYIAEGCLWNSGIFLLAPGTLLEEAAQHAPAVARASASAIELAKSDLGFVRLDETAFAKIEPASLDHAVMEKTPRAVVLPVDIGWRDMGSWKAMWMDGPKDRLGNLVMGDVVLHDACDTFVHSAPGTLTALVGVKDLVVVAMEDAVLVCDKGKSEDVKEVVTILKRAGRPEPLAHKKVYRPWGTYRLIASGERYLAKEICVFPGCTLSLQYHHHRAEHWVVVEGKGEVRRDDEILTLHENQSTYIAPGQLHQLANRDEKVLKLIEIQTGSYLGEDDIIRLHDVYNRD